MKLKDLINNIFFFLNLKLSKPREISLEITYRCNLDCSFCFNKIYNNNREKINYELSTKDIKKIIDNIADYGIERIRFSGGEPLIRDDLFELLAYAQSKGLKAWLNTNATLIDKQKVLYLSRFVENVLVPLNSFDLSTEFLLTNRFLFEDKINGIKLLKESGIKTVRVGTVVTKFNIQNLEKIYNLVNSLGIEDWQLFRPMPQQDNLFPIDNEDIKILIEKLLEIYKMTGKRYKILNSIPFCAYEPDKTSIFVKGNRYDDGHTRLVIDSYGKIKPMYYLNEIIGDIFINRDIKKYWNNKFIKDIRNLKLVPSICKKCKYLKFCLGGSRAISKLVSGSYCDLDYLAQPLRYKKYLFYK